jgi:hypothetical protein
MSVAIASKEKVFAAAALLASTGEKITLEKLRVALGGGSLSTIRDFLAQWREVQASSKPAPPSAEPAPAALSERMAAFLSSAWSDAMAMANARLDGERAALAGARGVLEDERREALEAGDALATELDAANTMISQFAANAKTSADELARLRQRLAKSEAETMATAAAKNELADVLATARADYRASQADVARLTGELATAQAREAAEARNAAAADKSAREATAKADRAPDDRGKEL